MRIIFSRKGFDSVAGGGPSPIVNGRPISLPIPAYGELSATKYGDLGFGEFAKAASRGKYDAGALCHYDPMFLDDGTAMLGQCSGSQGHLANQGVGPRDVFLFFGLFADEATGERHHRIFGFMEVDGVRDVASADRDDPVCAKAIAANHPHFIGMHGKNDTLYAGQGGVAQRDWPELRLTVSGGPASKWHRPKWLKPGGLTYFPKPENWPEPAMLYRVGNGQEFVADIGRRKAPRDWLAGVIDLIGRS
ncbi:MAG: hypothetical protein WA948_07445 [Pontixanthobacter sp.]